MPDRLQNVLYLRKIPGLYQWDSIKSRSFDVIFMYNTWNV